MFGKKLLKRPIHICCQLPTIVSDIWIKHCSKLSVLKLTHYCDVIMGENASQTTSLTIVYSIVYSDADQRKHQSSASLAFVRGIHRGPVNSPHKWPVTRKMFPFDDVIMWECRLLNIGHCLYLTHAGRVTHICSKLTIIDSQNGLSPYRRQALVRINTTILLIYKHLWTNFSEILIEMQRFALKKIHLKISSVKKAAILSRPQCVKSSMARLQGGSSYRAGDNAAEQRNSSGRF